MNPWELNFKNKTYSQAYNALFDHINMFADELNHGINYDQFADGYCIFSVNLTPEGADSGAWSLIQEGSTYLRLKFDNEIPDGGIEVFIFAQFDSLILIDRHRSCVYDYNL